MLSFHDAIGVPSLQKCGTKIRKRIMDNKKVGSGVGIPVFSFSWYVCMHLLAVSVFACKGKAKAQKMLINSKDYQDNFMELGREWDVSVELMKKLENFMCHLYAPKTTSTNVNELMYHLLCTK